MLSLHFLNLHLQTSRESVDCVMVVLPFVYLSNFPRKTVLEPFQYRGKGFTKQLQVWMMQLSVSYKFHYVHYYTVRIWWPVVIILCDLSKGGPSSHNWLRYFEKWYFLMFILYNWYFLAFNRENILLYIKLNLNKVI